MDGRARDPCPTEVGFAGIKADMARRAAATAGKKEEMTLYCPPRNWDPRHRMRAHLDIRFPGTRVQIVRPADYPEDNQSPSTPCLASKGILLTISMSVDPSPSGCVDTGLQQAGVLAGVGRVPMISSIRKHS